MSRLDSFIRRMIAQRACLNTAAEAVAALHGPVLELGLGNGRTYDHLREILPDRAIWVFERDPKPHPACRPPADRLIEGDLEATLPIALERIGEPAALVHADLGAADPAHDARMAALLATHLAGLTRPGAVVVSDRRFADPRFAALALPDGISQDRYTMLRRLP